VVIGGLAGRLGEFFVGFFRSRITLSTQTIPVFMQESHGRPGAPMHALCLSAHDWQRTRLLDRIMIDE
jgi:hypothetical protein